MVIKDTDNSANSGPEEKVSSIERQKEIDKLIDEATIFTIILL